MFEDNILFCELWYELDRLESKGEHGLDSEFEGPV
jgi:hypothetical protein